MLLLGALAAHAQGHATSDPAGTVRHVYKWILKPAQHKTLKGLYFAETREGGVKAHEADFTDEFLQAMREGFKAGTCDFDFLTCMLVQLPMQAPVVGKARIKGSTAMVPVVLTVLYRDQMGQGTLMVDLRQVAGVWKVANVRNTDGLNVLQQIKKQVKG